MCSESVAEKLSKASTSRPRSRFAEKREERQRDILRSCVFICVDAQLPALSNHSSLCLHSATLRPIDGSECRKKSLSAAESSPPAEEALGTRPPALYAADGRSQRFQQVD